MKDLGSHKDGDLVLGDDFISPDTDTDQELQARRARRGMFSLRHSSIAKKIITFNLIALGILAAGILFLNSSRNSLEQQHLANLSREAHMIADVFEANLPVGSPVNLITGDGVDVDDTLATMDLPKGKTLYVIDNSSNVIAEKDGELELPTSELAERPTVITDTITALWDWVSSYTKDQTEAGSSLQSASVDPDVLNGALLGQTKAMRSIDDSHVMSAASPIIHNGQTIGVIGVNTPPEALDGVIRQDRERTFQMIVIATLVSIGLSLILASTIANPLSDLAAAAEIGGVQNRNKNRNTRVRMPDLSGRPDEIGRLSKALRGMVGALYNRIEGNEQFAADVAHEIKNPLASLRSAVGTMRLAKKEEQREKLLDVIDHDVRRLDRLVTDISNASRLDSELVKEDQKPFDLLTMLRNLSDHYESDVAEKKLEFITDLPKKPVVINGLEARLAQVFVNLISNAISFCEPGDAIRLWARRRENRVLIVVEDTGPGIPDQALTKVFQRFYSQRDEQDFGNNSGLGLAISKQIVEAHNGVIWAENIRPADAEVGSDPLGARFVVGLPV